MIIFYIFLWHSRSACRRWHWRTKVAITSTRTASLHTEGRVLRELTIPPQRASSAGRPPQTRHPVLGDLVTGRQASTGHHVIPLTSGQAHLTHTLSIPRQLAEGSGTRVSKFWQAWSCKYSVVEVPTSLWREYGVWEEEGEGMKVHK